MLAKPLLLSSLLPLVQTQETVLGVYIFHRHGDRTSKSWPPTSLTDLGYREVYTSGEFYRNRYIDARGSSVHGISPNLAQNPQLIVQAPGDTVLQNSAAGFLQGLYPPVGATLGSEVLANTTTAEAPLGGFQLIPVNVVQSAASSSKFRKLGVASRFQRSQQCYRQLQRLLLLSGVSYLVEFDGCVLSGHPAGQMTISPFASSSPTEPQPQTLLLRTHCSACRTP
jgi:hypothetical protein